MNQAQIPKCKCKGGLGIEGKFLPFVRVFMTETQFELFYEYHQSDNSLKERILNLENDLYVRLENLPYILEGTNSKATKKVETSKIPLRPGSYPQFGIIKGVMTNCVMRIILVFWNWIKSLTFNAVTNEKVIGYVSEEKVDSETISNFLDSLRFSNHNPSTKSPEYRRWIDYANSYHVSSFTEVEDHDDHKTLVSVKRTLYVFSVRISSLLETCFK